MIHRPTRSLAWRAGLVLVSAQIVFGLFLGLWAYVEVRQDRYNDAARALREKTLLLSDRYRGMIERGDEGLQAQVRRDAEAAGVRITVVAAGGAVLGESHQALARMADHSGRPEVVEALGRGEGSAARYSTSVDEHMLYYALRLDDPHGGDPAAVLRMSTATTAINREIMQYVSTIALIEALLIAATALVLWMLSRHLKRHTDALSDGAQRFVRGDVSARITPPNVRELASLAMSFNAMASEMERRIDLAESRENEMRAILQSMSGGVMALDSEQRILTMNRAAREIFGLGEHAVSGRLLQEVVREPAVHRFVAKAMLGGEMSAIEYASSGGIPAGEPGDGRRLPAARVQVAGEILRDRDGETRGLLVLLQDVTRLRRLESMRSDFAANVSHELRTPITNIKGYVETLLDIGRGDPEQVRRFLKVIKQNSDRLASIVEDVLSLTRLEDERVVGTIERRPTRIAPLVRNVVAQFTERAEQKTIEIEADIEQDLKASVHAPLIEQALGNLLSNAINYSPQRTTVRLTASRTRTGEVALEVRDQGPGIEKAHLPRLFERFYRIDKGRSRELGGTGLGLAIVKHIMNVHGGRVEVESAVGRGSTFRLVMPAAE